MFANRQSLRALPVCFFTGRGRRGKRQLADACFLRKRPRGREATSPSPSAHYVRIHLSQGERPWQRDEVCVDCQGLPPRGSWHRAAMTERVQTEEVPLYIGIKPSRKGHTTSAAGARRSFPPAEKPADCASCTENALFDKTEKIKKKIRSFFQKTLAKCTKV